MGLLKPNCIKAMRTPHSSRLTAAAQRGAASPLFARGAWRMWVALLTTLSFVMLMAASSSHEHRDIKAEHDCVLCSAVLDQVADLAVPPALLPQALALSYILFVPAVPLASRAVPSLLPPSRGPPRASV